MENKLSHFDENGNAVMVDVSDKPVTHRTAVATGSIQVGAEIMERLTEGTVAKGDVLGVARVAGIMSVKHTSDLVPMCHPLPVTKCTVDFELEKEKGNHPHLLHCENRRQNRRGNGSAYWCTGDLTYHLRYV